MISRFFLLSASFAASLPAADIRLSPEGPVTSPLAARDAARVAEKPARIIVAAGVYPITDALSLGPEDSQTTWEAAPNAKPVISGGRKIGGWRKNADGIWQADVPEVAEGKWYFEQLWINGRRVTRARTPNKGFFRMEDRASSMIFPSEKPNDPKWEDSLKYHAFTTNSATIGELTKAPADELADMTVIIPHTWDVHHYHVKRISTEANAILLQGPSMRELLTNEPDGRFHVENYRAALDAPGEWYLSRKGQLFYLPLPGEDMTKAEVIAPVAEKLLTIDGTKDVAFKGISFQHQQWTMGPNGYGDPQAAHQMGAALEVDRSEGIQFDQCEIARTGGYALWFRLDVEQSGIRNSHIHDLGAGGVRIGPTSQGGAKKVTRFITVDNNIIQHGGRIFPDAIGVFLGHASDSTVTHNDIGDFYYTGISAGWHWGYGETVSHRNRYENNHIHHIGWGYTSDMGGFYNLGSSFGTVIRGNHIHDISSYRYGGWGLYTDEGSSGILMENNLVHDTRESGFHQHYGYYNTIRNNIFAFGKNAQIQRSRNEKRLSFIYENNIVVWNPEAKFLHGAKHNWEFNDKPTPGEPRVNHIMRNNLYWPTSGKMPERLAENWSWADWQKEGRDKGSLVADPLFENLEKRDFRLKPESPAFKIGFKPWDLTQAGVRSDGPQGTAWRELAIKAKFENWATDSIPWPSPPYGLPLKTFEFSSLDTLPIVGASVSVEKKGDSIGVSNESSSPIPLEGASGPSKQSLKIQDAPGLSQSYYPVLSLHPKWDPAPLSVSFDAMGQTNADWFFEIRTDAGGEFAAGPYVSWKKGKLTAGVSGGTLLADLPPGEWVRITIDATPGSGKWNVTLVRQNGSKQKFKDLPCKPTWNKGNYVLWSALANEKTAFFIDNLSLTQR